MSATGVVLHRLLESIWQLSLFVLVAFAGFSLLAYVVLPADMGWPVAAIFGFLYAAASYKVVDSAAAWFDDSPRKREGFVSPTLEALDEPGREQTNDADACMYGPLYLTFVTVIVAWLSDSLVAGFAATAALGVAFLLTVSLHFSQWPRPLLPASYRKAR